VSCGFTKKDPVKKYNSTFLEKNAAKIEKPRKKHEKLVKEVQEESHRKNSPIKPDSRTSNFMRAIKIHRNKDTSIEQNSTIQIDPGLSIYYRESRLKDKADDFDSFLLGNGNNRQSYLEENYRDYSEEKISFKNIKPTAKGLYGELKLRKEEERAIPSNLDFLKCFDYIDLMDRTKKEIYLKSKEAEKTAKPSESKTTGRALDSVVTTKEKLLKMFKGGNRTKTTDVAK
jgi:hypothetical protein